MPTNEELAEVYVMMGEKLIDLARRGFLTKFYRYQ